MFDRLPTRLDGEQHWNLREYRSAAGQVATISHGRFWLPGLAVTSKNCTYLNDALFKISVHAPQNAIWGMPFTRALSLPGVSGLIAGNRPVKSLSVSASRNRFSTNALPREMAAPSCARKPPSPPSALLYISRRDSPARQVENEDEVTACLEPYGFQIVTLSGMSVAAQAALFGSARVVTGPHGAGFANLLFCNPGTAVLEFFSPLYVNFCYWTLACGAGARDQKFPIPSSQVRKRAHSHPSSGLETGTRNSARPAMTHVAQPPERRRNDPRGDAKDQRLPTVSSYG